MTYVCPFKDHECGDDPLVWCSKCPRKTAPAKQLTEADVRRIVAEMQHQSSGTIVGKTIEHLTQELIKQERRIEKLRYALLAVVDLLEGSDIPDAIENAACALHLDDKLARGKS